jgi:SOS-response transcriptional repressor LexA
MNYQATADEIINLLRKEERAINADLNERADNERRRMNWESAFDLCLQSIKLCEEPNIYAQYCRAIALMHLGTVYQSNNDPEQARSHYQESAYIFSISEGEDRRWNEAVARYALGLLAQSTGDLALAQKLYCQSLSTFQDLRRVGVNTQAPERRLKERIDHLEFLYKQRQKAKAPEHADAIPVIGMTSAGAPTKAIEVSPDDVLPDKIWVGHRNCKFKKSLETEKSNPLEGRPSNTLFALKIKGESMVGVGIESGDYVIFTCQAEVAQNEIAVVRIDDVDGSDSTVKRFLKEGARIRLKAENPAYQDLVFQASDPDIKILGRAIAVVTIL